MSGFQYIENNRISKAQKRRDAKAAKKAKELERISQAEKLDEHKDRRLEAEELKRILDKRGLKVYDVEADGDCLYRAVEHQLKIANDSLQTPNHRQLRELTSQYMLENRDRFLPFLLNDEGDVMSQDEYENYCNRISKTRDWGGHLELQAISQITRKPIQIFQSIKDLPIIIEPVGLPALSPMRLSFHKHLYHLGEHYNSLIEV